ncbi:MAG TPA: serine hydrolase [Gemmatimonadaceae bacterium]|nr:serine hydrolase [Gemmatimonadaceae bacterium]
MATVPRAMMVLGLLAGQSAGAQRGDLRAQQVDKLFAAYARPNSPGCALAVMRNGHIVYEKAYGLANLEYGVPITPHTVFHVASLSKQFTAFAIQLLAGEGKLALDDDVRKYVPELHDFGTTITIRHLLHHTSGLRDQWSLLNMAGWRSGDIITEDDVLDLVWRQRALNFEPGAEELYSNTGYTLLGVIVQRVSGKTLRQFTAERIFGPLGMRRTHFNDDNTEVVAGRATSYSPRGADGFSTEPLQYANVGATNLLTTVEDLALWDRNFDEATVGGPAVVKAMLEPGMLSSGKAIDYASGLVVGDYRGLKTVEHGGSDAGFRSDMLQFPEARFSVVVLANLGNVNAASLARRVADIYLTDRLTPLSDTRPVAAPAEVKVDPSLYDGYAGDYLLQPDLVFTFSRQGDQLWLTATGRGKMQIFPASDSEFFFKGIGARLRFVRGHDAKADRVILTDGGNEMLGPRFTRALPTSDQLGEYAGTYYSDELGVVYEVSVRQAVLCIRHPRGLVTLEATQPDRFVGAYPIGQVQFVRDDTTGHVRGFRMTDGRARNVAFFKTHLAP